MRTYVRDLGASRPRPLPPSDRAPGAVAGGGCGAGASEAPARGRAPARPPLRGARVTQVREGGTALARPLPRRTFADTPTARVGRAGPRGAAGLSPDSPLSHADHVGAGSNRQTYVSAIRRAMRNSRAAQGGQNAKTSFGASSSSGSLPRTAIQPGASLSTHPHCAHLMLARQPTAGDRTSHVEAPRTMRRFLPSRRPDSNLFRVNPSGSRPEWLSKPLSLHDRDNCAMVARANWRRDGCDGVAVHLSGLFLSLIAAGNSSEFSVL